MGILKAGNKCIIMKGNSFGKKIVIDSIDNQYVYYKDKDKSKKINLLQVFPIDK